MNTRTLLTLIAIGLVSLLSGCATQNAFVAGVNAPNTLKTETYYKTNLKVVTAGAEAGDAASQLELAFIYGGYANVSRDLKTSNYWLEKSAAQNYLSAVTALGLRHYQYSKFGYSKDDELAKSLCYKAYEIYQSKPASEWSAFETMNGAFSLIAVADNNLSNRDLAQDLLRKAQKIGTTDKNTLYVLNDDLKKIGRSCK